MQLSNKSEWATAPDDTTNDPIGVVKEFISFDPIYTDFFLNGGGNYNIRNQNDR